MREKRDNGDKNRRKTSKQRGDEGTGIRKGGKRKIKKK